MAHTQQQDFCIGVRKRYPNRFENARVLDIGSLDINGNNRFLFTNEDYTGNKKLWLNERLVDSIGGMWLQYDKSKI